MNWPMYEDLKLRREAERERERDVTGLYTGWQSCVERYLSEYQEWPKCKGHARAWAVVR